MRHAPNPERNQPPEDQTAQDAPAQSQRPQVTERQVMELVRRWGWSHIESARPLEGDRDSNWRLDGRTGTVGEPGHPSDDARPVAMLKVCSPATSVADVDRIVRALRAAGRDGLPVPKVLEPTPCRAQFVHADDEDGAGSEDGSDPERLVLATSWVDGRKLAHARPILAEHARQVGRLMARTARALASVPAAGSLGTAGARHDQESQPADPFAWDLLYADRTIEKHLDLIEDEEARGTLEQLLKTYKSHTQPRLAALPRQLIHNDANDHNILVGAPGEDGMAPVTGLIDFGDCVVGPRVIDLAVAAAYLALGRTDPVAAVREVTAAWHEEWPLTDTEIELIPWLVRTRLAVSVVMAAYQRSLEPENAYLSVSERPAWTLLRQLGGEPAALNIFVMRGACGLEPVPGADRVRTYIERHIEKCAREGRLEPVIRPAVPGLAPVVFDFSTQSLEFRPRDLTVPGRAEDEIWRRTGDAVGVGRYGEFRLAYTGVQFATDWGEMRTLHIGLDLFRPPGTAVHAPLGGRIHSKHIHEEAFDYGGVIILEHLAAGDETGDGDQAGGQPFWTLYGHLSHESVLSVEVGQEVAAGEAFAALGAFDENGGWVPHLHMQLITDMLGRHATFPGVAPPSREAVWRSLCPDPSLLAGLASGEGCGFSAPSPASTEELLARRRRVLGPNLSLAYREPRHIVRGYMQYLYEPTGRTYLDAVNNVPHVGHQNERVVDAVARQYSALNTNTRYLHAAVLDFAERLAATLPDGLDVVYVVNSGSEANDLALRLARAATGREDVMVLDGAYHGHLTSLIGISPYKFDGPGGQGRPPGTHVVPMPDAFRGPYRGVTADTGLAYADTVRDALEGAAASVGARQGEQPIAAFIAESVPGCGGQIVPPPGYFKAAAAHVRSAGGLFIADEVQIGLGRAGDAFWGFELQDVVPDIVVVGKPIGNGQPLAAVVTTRAIADRFDNGMEYFNTFGGNPVSAAAGLAVLDELASEGLQEHARTVGGKLLADLRGLATRHDIIGDVRGVGLFLGVELSRPGGSLAPLRSAARYAVNRLADEGVLTSTDGPDGNVIKIKPPMVFTEQNAEYLVATLDRILGEDFCRAAAGAIPRNPPVMPPTL